MDDGAEGAPGASRGQRRLPGRSTRSAAVCRIYSHAPSGAFLTGRCTGARWPTRPMDLLRELRTEAVMPKP